jgi:uncharacterized protein YbjT (DUF2867 family)
MTISKELSAPLIVVVGATGLQGGSVVTNLEASDKPYRIRGLTRDTSKPSAQALAKRGVEVVACNISVGNEAEVREAFEGASFVFVRVPRPPYSRTPILTRLSQIVTNYWEHVNKARETAEGKLMVDAANAVGIKLIILSSAPSTTKLSKGRLTKVSHFDAKAEVSEYARSTGTPVVDIHIGVYMSNFTSSFRPRPVGDGSYILASTWKPHCRLALLDTGHDAGLFVRLAIESDEFNKGDGKVIAAYAEWMPIADQVKILSEISRKKVNYVQLSDEQLAEWMKQAGTPEHVVDDRLQMFRFQEEVWEDTYVDSNRANLARRPRTFREYCQAQDWSKFLL